MAKNCSARDAIAHDRLGREGRTIAKAMRTMALVSRELVFTALASVSLTAHADMVLVSADLQGSGYSAQLAQPGWQIAEVAPAGSSGTQTLPLTATGTGSGITATLVSAADWAGRGGPDPSRGYVQGTSFDGVLSDLWFTRVMTFQLQLAGLVPTSSYVVRTWHNDSYTLNGGAAAGGGTVHASLAGGTVSAAVDGTITNLSGSLTDASFVATSLTFQPSSTSATVTYTRNGGGFTGVPLSGVELVAVSAVPEPSACAMAIAGLGCGCYPILRRRHRGAWHFDARLPDCRGRA